MKLIKKISAVVLVAVMALSVTACHKKGETAVKIGDVEFSSAYYMCALINADMEGQQKVSEKQQQASSEAAAQTESASETSSTEASSSEETTSSEVTEASEEVVLPETASTSSEEKIYLKAKIGGKEYSQWAKDKAIESLKKIAAYKIKCKENKAEPKTDELSQAEQYAEYYWSSYGYSQIFEPNGVSKATYIEYMKDNCYSNAYFEKLYGKGGEKEVPAKDIKKCMKENYVAANVLDADFSQMEDADKKSTTTKFNDYYKKLKSGKMTFAQVYKDYNGQEIPDSTEEGKTKPKDKYATVLGSSETSYASDNYDTAVKMKTGEIKLIKKDNDAGYTIIIKQDINKDPYFLETLDMVIRSQLKNEEYNKDMEAYAATLKANVIKRAVKPFKLKKIEYPETNANG